MGGVEVGVGDGVELIRAEGDRQKSDVKKKGS